MNAFMTKKFLAVFAAAAVLGAPAFAQSPDWQRKVAQVVASKQTYPRTAQMRGEEGTAKVKVYVSASGAIEKAELVGPSGSATLDKEAISLVTKIGTLPAPPGGPAAVVLPLTWKLL